MSANLIGISGKIGSGKDTAAKIIQYILGHVHDRRPSWDFNDILNPRNELILQESSRWQIKKYAGKLKQIASILTGIPMENFEDQEFKKTNLGPEWNHWEHLFGLSDNVVTHNEVKMTVRTFLQKLGTEAMRDGLHDQVWINALYADFNKDSKWIITDCRFKNEFEAIKKRGGTVIYIQRGEPSKSKHPSETEMDDFKDKCDVQIDNNGDYADLEFLLGIFLSKNNYL